MNVFDADLPQVTDPRVMATGECPWDRYGRTPHDSWAGLLGNVVVVQDYATVKAVLADPRFHQGITVLMERNPDLDQDFVERRKRALLLRDGPENVRLRKTVVRAFTPAAAEKYRPVMRQIMQDMIDHVPADGRCDAVAVLTQHYPVRVISHVLGTPARDVAVFSDVAERILNAQSGAPENVADGLAAHDELDQHLERIVAARRVAPRADLVSDLLDTELLDGKLSDDEVAAIAGSLVMAGTDTTRNQPAIGLHLLATRPDVWANLDAEAVVDELLRFAPISHTLLRIATTDVQLHGATIPAGTLVMLNSAQATRDAAAAPDPNAFEPGQPRSLPHLAFGHGAKYCLGASLARLELLEAIRVLHDNFEAIELDGETRWRHVGFTQGPISLPLRFTRRSR